jgi:hypothetical protein
MICICQTRHYVGAKFGQTRTHFIILYQSSEALPGYDKNALAVAATALQATAARKR